MALRALLVVLLTASVLAAGCTAPEENGDPGSLEAHEPVAASAGCVTPGEVELDRPQPIVTLDTSMGDIQIEVLIDMVPITARNFLDHVEDGLYDGTQFHRIIRGFMMQGGNPATADPPKPPASAVEDEFHHLLRHDSAGVVSMANAGPNTGTSQFFITFGPTPHLDDRHSIFGRVIAGMDVVERVDAEAASADGTPEVEVVLERATVAYPDDAAIEDVELGLWTPTKNPRVAAEGGETGILLIAMNCSDALVPVTLSTEAPDGVRVEIEEGFDAFDLPAAQRAAVAATLVADGADPGTVPVTIVLTGPDGAEARLAFELERNPHVGDKTGARGDSFTAHYVGMLTDGRIFDTSYAHVATDPVAPKTPTFDTRERGQPFPFTAGQGVIEGFSQLATGLDEGATASGRMPPGMAYGQSDHPLAGRTLVFLLEAVAIEKA